MRAARDRATGVRATVPATTPPGNVASFPRLATRLAASRVVANRRRRADAAPSTSPATIRASRRQWAAKVPHRQPRRQVMWRRATPAKFDFGAVVWRYFMLPRQHPAGRGEEDV